MSNLNSKKLVAGIAGILGCIGISAIQAFQGGLTDQQFVLVIGSVTVLAGGTATVQGIIDYIKAGNGTPPAAA